MLRVGVAVRAAQNGNSGDRRAGAAGLALRSRGRVWCRARARPAVATLISPSYPERAAARGPVICARRQMRQQGSGAGLGGLPARMTGAGQAGPGVPRDLAGMAGLGHRQAGAARQFRSLRARAAVTGVGKRLAGRGGPRVGVGHPVRVRAGPGPEWADVRAGADAELVVIIVCWPSSSQVRSVPVVISGRVRLAREIDLKCQGRKASAAPPGGVPSAPRLAPWIDVAAPVDSRRIVSRPPSGG
jgi:hypothetical protein